MPAVSGTTSDPIVVHVKDRRLRSALEMEDVTETAHDRGTAGASAIPDIRVQFAHSVQKGTLSKSQKSVNVRHVTSRVPVTADSAALKAVKFVGRDTSGIRMTAVWMWMSAWSWDAIRVRETHCASILKDLSTVSVSYSFQYHTASGHSLLLSAP